MARNPPPSEYDLPETSVTYGIPPRTRHSKSSGRRVWLFGLAIAIFALSWLPVHLMPPYQRGLAIFISSIMWGLCVLLMVAAVRFLEEPENV